MKALREISGSWQVNDGNLNFCPGYASSDALRSADVCTHCAVAGLPGQYGPGLGFGQGEVLQIGLVQMSGQRSEVRRFGMHVVHVTGELCQQLLLLGLGHSTKTNGWETITRTESWKPPTRLGILCGSLFSEFQYVSVGRYDRPPMLIYALVKELPYTMLSVNEYTPFEK